jgi:ligand-binding sensor domain-containing protein/signal transduction histidine kinase
VIALSLCADASDSNKPLTQYTHTVWTRKDGIPSAFIYSLAQTRDGYLWLATTDGLVRFDGVRFVHWRPTTGHTDLLGAVRSLCAARDGSLWIGTAAGLVGHVRGDNLTTVSVGAQPEAILEDRDGIVWVATENRVLRFRATSQEQIGDAVPLPGPFVSGLLQHRSGSIWLTTDAGVVRLDPADSNGGLAKMGDGKFWLCADASGTIWITSAGGFSEPLREGQPFGKAAMSRKTLNIQTVLRDSRGNTWIGTLGQGLTRMRAASGRTEQVEGFSPSDGLSADSVWCLLEDREQNIWVGTQNGLNRFRDEKVRTLTSRDGLISDDVDALAAGPDGSIWASTSIGVQRLDGEHRDVGLTDTRTSALHVDRTNTVWVGTDRGIARMHDGQWRYLPMPAGLRLTAVTAMTGDDEKGVWFADARQGLYRWINGRVTDFSDDPLFTGQSVRAAQADAAGRVWFGFYEGGVVYFDGDRFHAYSKRDGLAGGSVNAVHIDDTGTVWIASERGLSRLDDQRFVSWNRANGLPGERVQWILTDSGDRIWLGYSTGVAWLTRAELDKAARDSSYRVAFQFLDEADGLKGNPDRRWQSAAVRARDRSLWFRTSEGVAIIDSEHMARNLVAPPVQIERMVADAAGVDIMRPVRLRPLTRNVEIDYTALSLAEPRNVRFRYKLEGFDAEWRDVGGRRQAFYTNLPPRAYRFRVLAANNDGVWNESGAGLDFTLLPAFYQTRAFLLLCALVAMILAWGLYRVRVWQVTSRLRDRFEERLKERTRIAQELHDNLIQDVMGISLQIEVTDVLLPSDVPAKQSLERALRLCKSALDGGRRALNDLRSVPLSAGDLVQSFSQLTAESAGGAGIKADVVVEGRERPLNALAGNDVLQVGRQAIANAFQHAHATEIHVLLSYGPQHLQVRVQDNGRGMTEEKASVGRPGHYGIAGMQERAERMGGSLSIRSRVGEGTEVHLSVPSHLVYQDDALRSASSVADRWHSMLGRLRMRRTDS